VPTWDAFLTTRDKQHLAIWGKREPFGFGRRPAVLVVDDYYRAVGLEREPLLESIKTWPASCGLEGWEAIDQTVELLAAARNNGVPVIYLKNSVQPIGLAGARSDSPARDKGGSSRIPPELRAKGDEIVADIAPHPAELVLDKSAPSGFQGTPLLFQLNYLSIDTILVCGESTSGCVRATVVDGATNRFRVGVVADCCFDRTEASHHINLFDMHQKYADVIDLAEAKAYFQSLTREMNCNAGEHR
jgi:maleamate amidohydrolase